VHRTPGPIACRYVRVPCRTPAGRGGMESSVSLLAVAHSPAAARALSDYQHRAMSTRLHFVTQRVLALRRRRGRLGRSARVWPDSEPAPRDPHGTGSLRSLDAFAAEGRFRRDRASSDPNRLSGGVPPGHWSWDTGVVHEALPTDYPAGATNRRLAWGRNTMRGAHTARRSAVPRVGIKPATTSVVRGSGQRSRSGNEKTAL
jgi:hypothetical protein